MTRSRFKPSIQSPKTSLRHALVVGFGLALALPLAVSAGAEPAKISSPVANLLGNASDSALDKLSQPGAFYADKAIRITLPGAKGNILSKGLKFGNKLGLTGGITKSLNDAAGRAAKDAKPIFRTAINDLSWKDAPRLITKKDGGTRYLQDSASDQLSVKIRPLVESALNDTGAFKQLEKLQGKNSLLGSAGLSKESLTDSVTKQTLNGIFKYMASEEGKLRKNPLKTGKKIIDIFN